MRRSLLIRNPDGFTSERTLDKAELKIGRASDNDLLLLDEERSVSRWHALLTVPATGAVGIADLKSANGIRVNGRKIELPVELHSNDSIQIGRFTLTFREEGGSLIAPLDDPRFKIEAGPVTLDELQKEPTHFPVSRDAERKNLELLYEVGVKLARSHSLDEVISSAVALLFRIEEVHRAAVILWDSERGQFHSMRLHGRNDDGKTSWLPRAFDPKNLVMSRTILDRVRAQNIPLLIRDAEAEAILDPDSSIIRAGIQAALCAPLSFHGEFLGIVYADNLAEPDAFSDAHFRTFSCIAAQTGLALANALATERLRRREAERQALRQYLPPQVADMILAAGGASQLQGTLQPVTVLYADIRGFTAMSEQLAAAEIVRMLSEFFSLMSTRILECNGTLDKFIGDCIMALFGAPVPSATAPRDAIVAAIGMQQAIAAWNGERLKAGLRQVEIGIGLHCGPAVVGNIGSVDRVQYTAIGDTVNVASRLVNQAAPGQIIVSEAIRAAIPEYTGFCALGSSELKGRSGPILLFEVCWKEVPFDSSVDKQGPLNK
jgi:adenylate cyclase